MEKFNLVVSYKKEDLLELHKAWEVIAENKQASRALRKEALDYLEDIEDALDIFADAKEKGVDIRNKTLKETWEEVTGKSLDKFIKKGGDTVFNKTIDKAVDKTIETAKTGADKALNLVAKGLIYSATWAENRLEKK